jgi:hypothetical protein
VQSRAIVAASGKAANTPRREVAKWQSHDHDLPFKNCHEGQTDLQRDSGKPWFFVHLSSFEGRRLCIESGLGLYDMMPACLVHLSACECSGTASYHRERAIRQLFGGKPQFRQGSRENALILGRTQCQTKHGKRTLLSGMRSHGLTYLARHPFPSPVKRGIRAGCAPAPVDHPVYHR